MSANPRDDERRGLFGAVCHDPISIITGLFSVVSSVIGIFNKPKAASIPSAPTAQDPAALQAAQDQRTAAANAAGRASTIGTSGQGDQAQATTAKSTLLGVM